MYSDEVKKHARRIIEDHNMDYEFCLVYEDEEVPAELFDEVYEAMFDARMEITW